MIGDQWSSLPTSFLEGPFLSCDNTALEKSQMQPLVINDCDLSVDDDLELSQNITEELPAKVTTVTVYKYIPYV